MFRNIFNLLVSWIFNALACNNSVEKFGNCLTCLYTVVNLIDTNAHEELHRHEKDGLNSKFYSGGCPNTLPP